MFKIIDTELEKLKNTDRDLQRRFLTTLSKYRYMDVEYLLDLGCFFIPSDDYLIEKFGTIMLDPALNLYNYEGECNWLHHLVIPIRGVYGNLVGFTGYNPATKLIIADNKDSDNPQIPPPKYVVLNKSVFDKNKFMLMPNGYSKAFDDGYIILVDGIFDALTLGSLGFNSACSMGTFLSDYNNFLLSFIPRKIVGADNDRAGLDLWNYVRNKFPESRRILQKYGKDIDECVKVKGADYVKNILDTAVNSSLG